MAILISTHNSDGSTGRCDAKCYNATKPHCDCCCDGANHGVGLIQAADNTRDLAIDQIKQNAAHLTSEPIDKVRKHQIQKPLFD